jgi:hypothetical protein
MTDTTVRTDELVAGFVEAFNAGDSARILEFFDDDASIQFMAVNYRGRETIGQWLGQRFGAGAQIMNVSGVDVSGDTLTIHAGVTSRKLQSWRLGTINGRAEMRLDGAGRIVECRLGWDGLKPGGQGRATRV